MNENNYLLSTENADFMPFNIMRTIFDLRHALRTGRATLPPAQPGAGAVRTYGIYATPFDLIIYLRNDLSVIQLLVFQFQR